MLILGACVTRDIFICQYILSGDMTKMSDEEQTKIALIDEEFFSHDEQIKNAISFFESNKEEKIEKEEPLIPACFVVCFFVDLILLLISFLILDMLLYHAIKNMSS